MPTPTDPDKPTVITATKAVNDICFNPFNSNMFASHSEPDAVVKVWDMRKMTEAVCLLNTVFESNGATAAGC
jgi:WD40 repeat protein